MVVEASEVQRMYVHIVAGVAKDDYPGSLSKEASVLWDQITREVEAIRQIGGGFEMVEIEVPDIPSWVAEAPEAKG